MADFSEDEIAVIESAIQAFSLESASVLSRLSHQELGWRLAAWREVIPYNTVFLGRGVTTDADIRRGQEWLPSITGTSAWLLCAGFVESDTFSKSKADLKTAFDLGDREIDDRCGQFGET